MKKTLLKHCNKRIGSEQREKNMLVIGQEMFDKKVPKKDIPMYRVVGGKLMK